MKQALVEQTPPAAAGGVFFLLLNSFPGTLPVVRNCRILIFSGMFLFILLAAGIRKSASRKTPVGLHRMSSVLVTPVLLFAAGFSLTGTSALIADFRDRLGSPGIRIDDIRGARAALTTDARPISAGGWVVEGRLEETVSEHARAAARGRVVIFGSGSPELLAYGRIAEFRGSFRRSEPGRNLPLYVITADSFSTKGWSAGWKSLRHRVFRTVESRLASAEPDTASFATALLLGRRTDTGSPIMRRFGDAGCMHLLALSGFHVGLIALGVRFLLKPLAGYSASAIISAAAAVFFLILTGIRPSLLRAVLMYLLWTADSLRGRKIHPISYLSSAFLIQTVLTPESVHTLSFRLSYTALAGLLTAGTAYSKVLCRFMPGKAAAALGAGLGAQFLTLPLVISVFGLWRPIGIAAAPVLTVLTSMVMALGSLCFISGAAVEALNFLVKIVCRAASPFSRVPPVPLSGWASWLITSAGTIIPFITIRSIRREQLFDSEPRLPGLNPSLSGEQRPGTAKKMGTELSDKPRRPRENYCSSGTGRRPECLGDRSRTRSHERNNSRCRDLPDRIRD